MPNDIKSFYAINTTCFPFHIIAASTNVFRLFMLAFLYEYILNDYKKV